MLHFDFRGSRRPPLHTHTPRTFVRTLHQGPTQNVTPSPKCRNKRGKLLGFSTLLKPVPSGRGTWRSRTPFKIRAVDVPGAVIAVQSTFSSEPPESYYGSADISFLSGGNSDLRSGKSRARAQGICGDLHRSNLNAVFRHRDWYVLARVILRILSADRLICPVPWCCPALWPAGPLLRAVLSPSAPVFAKPCASLVSRTRQHQ